MDSISKRVRAARQHMSYTQKELSEKCGISQQSINKLEMAKTSSPRKDALKSLSQALDVPESWLLFGERPPTWAVKLGTEKAYAYARKFVPVTATLDLYDPSSPVGYANALVDSENAFGLRINRETRKINLRVGCVSVFNPDIDVLPNDMIGLFNPKEKPIVGIVEWFDDKEIFLSKFCSGETQIIQKNDFEICAVLQCSWGRRWFTPSEPPE